MSSRRLSFSSAHAGRAALPRRAAWACSPKACARGLFLCGWWRRRIAGRRRSALTPWALLPVPREQLIKQGCDCDQHHHQEQGKSPDLHATCASRDSQLLKLDSGLAALNNLQSSFTLWEHERSCAMNVWLHKQVMVKLAKTAAKSHRSSSTRSRPPAAHALGGTADAGTSFLSPRDADTRFPVRNRSLGRTALARTAPRHRPTKDLAGWGMPIGLRQACRAFLQLGLQPAP